MGDPMPIWLRNQLIERGVLTAQGLSRKAKIIRHRPCGFPTLAGFDADVAALDAWCDLADLSLLGEAMALLDGRRTYTLMGQHLEDRQSPGRIAHFPADHTPVYAQHRCHQPIPASWCKPATTPAAQPQMNEKGFPF